MAKRRIQSIPARRVALLGSVLLVAGCGKDPVTKDVPDANRPPVIRATGVSKLRVLTNELVTVTVSAYDPDPEPLSYRWTATRGSFPQGFRGPSVAWHTPEDPGLDSVFVAVWDWEDTTRASRAITVHVVAAPDSLDALPGTSIVDLRWKTSLDDGVDGWEGYEVFRATRSFDLIPTDSLGAYLVAGSLLVPSFRSAGLTRGVRYWFKVRAARGWAGHEERSSLTGEVEAIPRPEWNKQIQELMNPLGGQAFDLSAGEVRLLDPADPSGRFSRDLYFGTSDPLDGPGPSSSPATPRLKSVSLLANRNPLWGERVTRIKRVGGTWLIPPIIDDGWSEEVDLELGAVYAIKTAEGNFAKLLVADLLGTISPYRQLTVKWAYQTVSGYPKL